METRIWCEFTKPEEVCRDFVLDAFRRYDVILNYKLEFGQDQEGFFKMLETYNRYKRPVSVWATLSDEMGYWINEKNVHYFDRYIRSLVGKLEERALEIKGLCIDLESPLADIMRLTNPKTLFSPALTYLKMLTRNLNKKSFYEARKTLAGTADFLRSKGLESYATCIRHCYYDLRFNSEIMQNALEIPVFDIPWDKYNLMYYATMIRNELKKIRRVDVDYLIYHQVSHLKEKLKEKLAISVGVTNVGKMGNEPYYESLEEFEKDMGILKACGIEDFSLFSLDGILEEKRLTSFLEAMRRAKPYKPEPCRRVIRNEAASEALFNAMKLYYWLRK